MANNLKTKVITGIVRLSYEHVWEPVSINGGEPKYSASLIIPKSDKKTVKAIEEAVEAAITEGTLSVRIVVKEVNMFCGII